MSDHWDFNQLTLLIFPHTSLRDFTFYLLNAQTSKNIRLKKTGI